MKDRLAPAQSAWLAIGLGALSWLAIIILALAVYGPAAALVEALLP